MTVTPRVYVVHPVPQNDLSPAENFGKLTYITHRYIYGDEIKDEGTIPDPHNDKLVEAVRKFRPNEDYLLIAGDHVQLMVMAAYLARAYKSFRILRYDRELSGYLPIRIDAR